MRFEVLKNSNKKMNLRLRITLEFPFHSIVILFLLLNDFPAPFISSDVKDTVAMTEHPHENGERVSWLQCMKAICHFIWLSSLNWCQACLYKGIYTLSEKLVWLTRQWGKMEGGGNAFAEWIIWSMWLFNLIFIVIFNGLASQLGEHEFLWGNFIA